MGRLLDRLHGQYFDFLVIDEYDITKWDEDCVPLIDILSYIHHPDALLIADDIIGLGALCFNEAHPRFNYYGPTLYQRECLDSLLMRLRAFVQSLLACSQLKDFERHAKRIFEGCWGYDTFKWKPVWRQIRDEVVTCYEEVILLVREAQATQKALLVLGI